MEVSEVNQKEVLYDSASNMTVAYTKYVDRTVELYLAGNLTGNATKMEKSANMGVRLTLCSVYSILFCIGVLGNLWVILTIQRMKQAFQFFRPSSFIKRSQGETLMTETPLMAGSPDARQRSLKTRDEKYASLSRRKKVAENHLLTYIMALSCVDLLVLSVLPFTISYTYSQYWAFGNVFCKLYWLVESVNKVLSITLLTALSFDRFISINFPYSLRILHTPKGVCCVVLACATTSALLLSPIIVYSKVILWVSKNGERLPFCNESMPKWLIRIFISYIFVCGYFFPAVLITFFYSSVLKKVKSQAKRSIRSCGTRIPVARVAKTISSSILFYFVCWTPYWAIVLLSFIKLNSDVFKTNAYLYVWTFSHTLPVLNSAGNWIFYALLNNEIRKYNFFATLRCRTKQRDEEELPMGFDNQCNEPLDTFKRKNGVMLKDEEQQIML